MTVYAPGSLETDPTKQNMALQEHARQIGSANTSIATNTASIASNTTNIATNTTNIATNTSEIAAMQAAWTAYTPVITAGSGTFTSVSAAGRSLTIGKTTFISIAVTITTNGTAAASIIATLPNTAGSVDVAIAGREMNSSGKMLQARIAAGGTTAQILNYDNTYPGGSGFKCVVSGVYENARPPVRRPRKD